MAYQGSCHCGAVAFTVKGELPDEAISCNCSHCRRKGFLLSFVAEDDLALHNPDAATTSYRFNKHAIDHQTCARCGCQALAYGKDKEGKGTVMVNLRCVPEADLDALKIKQVDGASF